MSIPIPPNQKTEKSIMEYIQDGKTEWLESQVREQLTRSLGFDIQVPQPFIPSDSAALFMPFAKVALAIPPTVSASETIYLFNQTFQVLEWAEQDGYLTLLCMSPEGPYARTVTDVVTNIFSSSSSWLIRRVK